MARSGWQVLADRALDVFVAQTVPREDKSQVIWPAMEAVIPVRGDVLLGRYRIEEEIGRGGMGVVLRARDESDNPYAIKVLLPEAVDQPEAVPRFMKEAEAARELKSDYVVRVFEAGTLEGGLPFMVMELLDGTDLCTILEKGGPMSVPDAVDAIIEACDGLADAHARGMVHRDLKPSNLFASKGQDGRTRVKVLDFGVSKTASTARSAALTSTGMILGSPHYMAPEQLKSAKDADSRADIYSLGVVLYELVTGQIPFDGRSFGQLFMQIVTEEPKPLIKIKPDVAPGLNEIVMRCMKKNRDERYADLASLATALARFASPRGAAVAGRMAGESPAVPPRAQPEARPPPGGLGGTMLMSNAPANQIARQVALATAQAAQASQAPRPPANAGNPNVPRPDLKPTTGDSFAASRHSSGHMPAAAPHAHPALPAPHAPSAQHSPQAYARPSTVPTGPIAMRPPPPAQRAGLSSSTAIVLGIVVTLVVMALAGVALIVLSRRS